MSQAAQVPEAEVKSFKWKGERPGALELWIPPGVFEPSPTSLALASAIDIKPGETVIDVGTGCGILGFIAAGQGASRVFGSDISEESINAARVNARRLGLDNRTDFRVGDMFKPFRDIRADVIIGDVSGIPDVIAKLTGWFPSRRGGGRDGSKLPAKMLKEAVEHLNPGGRLYFASGTIQNEAKVLAAAQPNFLLKLLSSKTFPLPKDVADAKGVHRLVEKGLIQLEKHGSRLVWQLNVHLGTLKESISG